MKNKGKIVGFLIPEFPQQTHIFFWREMEAFRELGIESEIVSTRKADTNLVKHEFAKSASESAFYLHPPKLSYLVYVLLHPIWLLRALRYVLKLKSGLLETLTSCYFTLLAAGVILWCKKHGIRHVHGHSCANVGHILALASLSSEITYSLTLHGGLSVYGHNHKQKMENALFVSTVTRPLQHEVNQVANLPIERIPVISMGVSLEKFSPRNRIYNADKPLNLISVARLAHGKGHIYSLRALHRLKNEDALFYYTIVGSGDFEPELREEVSRLELDEHVFFAGSLGENEVQKQLEQTDVLLLTSFGLFEAAPVCVMEAMASGIPTVTSKIGGTPDMISHGIDGFLVEQQNVDEIFHAIKLLYDDRELLKTMGLSARIKAEKLFDYKRQAKLLLSHMRL